MYARLGIRECREIARRVLSRAACVRRAPTARMGMRAAAAAGAVRVNWYMYYPGYLHYRSI